MPTLIRTLRLRDLLFLFIGSVIGSGIFLSPGLILRQVNGSVGLSMLVWVAGGVMSLLGALTYAELAAANPEAGGLYCYIRDGFVCGRSFDDCRGHCREREGHAAEFGFAKLDDAGQKRFGYPAEPRFVDSWQACRRNSRRCGHQSLRNEFIFEFQFR